MQPQITVRNARLHNLKNITVSLPTGKLVALTGVSGSGKSTLGIDILLKEGQRQYMETLGMLPIGYSRPPVDSISGLTPTVSLGQSMTNRSPRSTVGTSTDIYAYVRVLFARLGQRPCPACGHDAPTMVGRTVADLNAYDDDDGEPELSVPCPQCGTMLPEIRMGAFSFNKPAGACPTCSGLGMVRQANLAKLVDEGRSIAEGAVSGWDAITIRRHGETLTLAGRHYGMGFALDRPLGALSPAQRDLLLYGTDSAQLRGHFPGIEPPRTLREGRFEGIANILLRRYAEHVQDEDYLAKLDEFLVTQTCPDCGGTRLRPESRAVTLAGQTIVDAAAMPLKDLAGWLDDLPGSLNGEETGIAGQVLTDLRQRVGWALEMGVEYLSLDRASSTLSAGEAQRLRMATLLGSSLSGVLYVFDEPTIGLHARDTGRLIGFLRRLRDLGNSVLVIEHDLDLIRAADHVVDFGPGAGKHGGQIVGSGRPDELAGVAGSLTGAFLAGRADVAIPERRAPGEAALTLHGAREHNLRDITARFPVGLLTAVTGVSGSGKSTLVFDILDRAGRARLMGADEPPGEHDSIDGWEHFDKIVTVDQAHVIRIPRSNAATYTDVFTPIREAFAATADARERGLTARHFSFNAAGGRCERCQGMGTLAVRMQLMPDAEVTCPVCKGRRFKPETLAVRYQNHDIAEVLDLTIEEALASFEEVPAAAARLQVMVDVGLGYLQLGQPATTLSGGEAQRVKLAKELGRRMSGRTLYLLDEPTTGLHPADTARLLTLLERLVDGGNSVIVVEHNLELIRAADWVIDLGPEGGAGGGRVMAEGTPEDVARVSESHTGVCLRAGVGLGVR